jgi:hypothetical protein
MTKNYSFLICSFAVSKGRTSSQATHADNKWFRMEFDSFCTLSELLFAQLPVYSVY